MNFTEQSTSVIVDGHMGIGRALADALRERPGRVLVASRRSGLDATDPSAVEHYFDAIGTIDHLVFTAGSQAPVGQLLDMDLSAAWAAFDAKFWGSLAVAKVGTRYLRPGGSLTLTSGLLARRAVPGTFVKTAMNAALEAVVKALARELAPLRMNVVNARLAMLQRATDNLPVGCVGRPQELIQGYLLAIDNPFMTGAVIDIDGGALIN